MRMLEKFGPNLAMILGQGEEIPDSPDFRFGAE
jgi:hypothetical protein